MNPNVIAPKSYRFHFWKDKYWAMILFMPIVFICLSIVAFEFYNIVSTEMQLGPLEELVVLIILGFPIWVAFWFFLYYFFKFLYTRVIITDTEIYHRAPLKIFPFIPKNYRLAIKSIERVDLEAKSGGMPAIFLYYRKNKKQKCFYLPRFNNPEYIKELTQIHTLLFTQIASQMLTQPGLPDQTTSIPQTLQQSTSLRPAALDKALVWVGQIFAWGLVIGVGYTMAKFTTSVEDAWLTGITAASFAYLIGFLVPNIGRLPFIGQLAYLYLGEKFFSLIFGIFHIDVAAYFLQIPPGILKIIHSWFPVFPVTVSLLDFIFYDILALSILVSIDVIDGWLRKRINNRKSSK